MAVQAQYPSIATFRDVNNNNNVLENFHQDHHGYHQVLFTKGTVFSDDPESELTCNFNFVSASTTNTKRKNNSTSYRGGRDDQMPHQYPNQQHQHQHQENVPSSHNYNYNYNYNYLPYFPSSSRITTKLPKLDQLISTVEEENRLNQQQASTSGKRRRRSRSPPLLPHHSQHHLNSSYYYQNLDDDDDDEVDALIRLQHETLRSVVEQRQWRLLVSFLFLEQQVQTRLKEKQIELENALGRNAELEEKVKQMSSENQMWFNVAKNNQAMVLSLRSTLEHQMLINQKKNQNTMTMGLVVDQGFGDSSDGVADDAHSSNNHQQLQLQVNVGQREYKTVNSTTSKVDVRDDDDDASMMMMMIKEKQQQQQQHRKICKVCKEMEVSVLLLPCRHLCLCKDCEAKLQACPICNSFKNASLQIFMS